MKKLTKWLLSLSLAAALGLTPAFAGVSAQAADQDPMSSGQTPEQEAAADNSQANSLRKADSSSTAKTATAYGVDVSQWQGNIDWAQAKAAGVDFALIRVAYRTYGSIGKLYTDKYAKKNIEGAQAQGIRVGVYCFSTAITDDEALEEAKYTLSIIKGYNLDLPVVYDHEGYTTSRYRNYDKHASSTSSVAARTRRALIFMNYVESQGYDAMIYNSAGHLVDSTYWDLSQLEGKYDIWIAQYYYKNSSTGERYHTFTQLVNKPSWYTGEYRFWQGTDSGKISGISGYVDLDIEYGGSSTTLQKQTSGTLNGWVKTSSGTYYYKNGAKLTGQHKISGSYYYFDPDTGAMVTSSFVTLKTKSGKKYKVYYGSNGKRVSGQHKIGGSYYCFTKKTGQMYVNKFKTLTTKSGKKYKVYYGSNGKRVSGQHKIGGSYYCFTKKTGQMYVNKFKTLTTKSGKKYKVYYGSNGKRVSGLRKIGKFYYCFTKRTGQMYHSRWVSFKTSNGMKYRIYFNKYGHAKTLKVKKSGKWYTLGNYYGSPSF